MINNQIAKILFEISVYLDMEGVAFKPRAYEKAALAIEALEDDLKDIYKKEGLNGLKRIPGVGESIAEKIEEYIKTGRIKYHEDLRKKMPIDLENLLAIEGLGPKMIKKLYKSLKIKNIDDLEKAALSHKIRKLPTFGEKTEENILKGIGFLKKSKGRFVLGFIHPLIKEIENRLKKLKEVEKIQVSGSVRRMKETIGDIDFLAISKNPSKVMDFFVSMPEVINIYSKGKTKSSVRLNNGIDADLRIVKKESFGSASQYFTGNKDHNIILRKIAQAKGLKLNEYGLFKGRKQIAGESEEEIYKILGLDYIEPELRENTGEIEAAQKHKLPKLIGYHELRGDLQVQTNWTDGSNSIEEMAEAAQKLGLEYIAITDHTKSLAMTGGSDEKKLLKQVEYIKKLNSKLKKQKSKFTILVGAEVNILKDGSLDIKDEVLKKLDIVGAAIHSHFNLSKQEQTKRLIRAMENRNVNIIFHPTGRIIKKRNAYEINIDEIIKAAKKTGTILEINAYPDRLDLKDEYIKKAVESGVKLAIDSDAHSINHFHYLYLGIAQARRGWATKNDIINAWPLEKMLKFLKG